MSFSIVIPCRDDQGGLDRAVRSVLSQSIDDLEVIVVDDGSREPLAVPDDSRIRLLRREEAGGPAAARNLGLRQAAGEFVGWCDSDDYFASNRLSIAAREHAVADVVVVGQRWAWERDETSSVVGEVGTVLDHRRPSRGPGCPVPRQR